MIAPTAWLAPLAGLGTDMAGKIETAFLSSEGNTTPSVPEITPPMGADTPPKGSGQRETDATDRVSQSRHSLSDADREQAIERAAALVEYLHALAQLHWALLTGQGDYFTHKAAYDLALSDCHAARGIMERLIKGRSAAQVARMERERGLDLPACANEERAA